MALSASMNAQLSTLLSHGKGDYTVGTIPA